MVNVGPLELLVIAVIALIVLGPARLPEVARSVGRGMREFRSALTDGGHDDEDDHEDEDDAASAVDDIDDEIPPPPLPSEPPAADDEDATEPLPEGR